MEPFVSAGVLGFVLGLQHATDPDHLVAVATIATRERRFAGGALIGLAWGAGHMLALGLAGGVIVALGVSLPAWAGTMLELIVALMLVTLGALRLCDAARGMRGAGVGVGLGDHDHGGREIVHTHHGTPHVHPSARLLRAWAGERRRLGLRALVIGMIHGMAGTAAVGLLVMTTLRTAGAAALYLLVFGLGTMAAMTALTAAMSYPVARLARLRHARDAMALAAGVGAIAFGCWYAARVI